MRAGTVGKLLGLAGLAGVAATGVVLARDERQRRAYTPDDVRARLHARAEAAQVAEVAERFAAAHDEPAPAMVEARDGLLFLPQATTRRGRLAQKARWHRRRLVDPVTTSLGNQVSRVRRGLTSNGARESAVDADGR